MEWFVMRNPKSVGRAPLADRLFIGACTAAYIVLAGVVVAALRAYGAY
jgi:predicted small integral membrane protein